MQNELQDLGVVVLLDGVDEVHVLLEQLGQGLQGQLIHLLIFPLIQVIYAKQAKLGLLCVLGADERDALQEVLVLLQVLRCVVQAQQPEQTLYSLGGQIAGGIDDLNQLGGQPQLLQVLLH